MTASLDKRDRNEVMEVAAYWATRLQSDDCTATERSAFEKWRRQAPAHAAAYRDVEAALGAVYRNIDDPDLIAYAAEVSTTPDRSWRRRWSYAAVAASLAACVALVALVGLQTGHGDGPAEVAAARTIYEATVGERSTTTLSDGSEITLNTDTQLHVALSSTQRRLTLVGGQAFFKVAKDPTRPFVVEAGSKRVVAVGTEFDVRFDGADKVLVTLVEGRVVIDQRPPAASKAAPVDPVRMARIELAPGQQMIASGNEQPAVREADVERVTSWSQGRLVFDNDPLPVAVAEVNRYTTRPIVLAEDQRLNAILVGGVFQTGRQESFLLALETLHPIAVEQRPDSALLVWRE